MTSLEAWQASLWGWEYTWHGWRRTPWATEPPSARYMALMDSY